MLAITFSPDAIRPPLQARPASVGRAFFRPRYRICDPSYKFHLAFRPEIPGKFLSVTRWEGLYAPTLPTLPTTVAGQALPPPCQASAARAAPPKTSIKADPFFEDRVPSDSSIKRAWYAGLRILPTRSLGRIPRLLLAPAPRHLHHRHLLLLKTHQLRRRLESCHLRRLHSLDSRCSPSVRFNSAWTT